MTTPRPDPPLAPDEVVAAGTEREVLEAFLDFHREVLVRKVSGVSEQEADDETVASLVAEYRRACEESRQTAARFALDDTVPQRRLGQVSLRWIYVHMIEETARHVGHADILREQTDGATGVDG